jgi:transposase, IS30 family
MGTYKRVNLDEREYLPRLLEAGLSYREIGRKLKRSTSTISREVRRAGQNRVTYKPSKAERHTRRHYCRRHRKIDQNARLRTFIRNKLALRWSPREISIMLRKEYPDNPEMQVSHETIYSYLYVLPRGQLKKELLSCLRQKRRLRKNRSHVHEKRGQIIDMISIEERPAEVADRTVPGHWEGDLLMGKDHQSAVATLVDRSTRFLILIPLKKKDATAVRKAYEKEIMALPALVRKSLTVDRGKENAEHALFTEHTKMQVYFAHPQSPWERGTNENTNGLIRDFFPKKIDFGKVTRREIKRVQRLLNERPRAVLHFDTPAEAMSRALR